MESYLNKLRDTVSATVYQVTTNLTTALPGNAITREYEIGQLVGTAGPNSVYKIYEATKKSTKQEASLFILEKKLLDKLTKKEKELFLESVRHGVSQLSRLKHPSILTVQHNLEESRDLIAFATEPVIASLANLINKQVKNDDYFKGDEQFYDVEIKYGILQLSEGLVFLHNEAKILHRNICPENVIINKNGIWKISGFDFSVQVQNINDVPYKYASYKVLPDISLEIQPNFSFSAPECFDVSCSTVEASSDIFSLGMMAMVLYNGGNTLVPFNSSFQFSNDKFVAQMKEKLKSPSSFIQIAADFRDHLKLLLSLDPSLRPDALQISKLEVFKDVLVRTLQYFDSLFQWDNEQKAQFYRSLPDVLTKMPKRVKMRQIASGLAKEFVNPDMVPFVLPNMFQISKELSDEEFHTWIVPNLVVVFKYKEPIQIGIYLLQNMDFLVLKFKSQPQSLREHIIPLIYRFLESGSNQIQELCLTCIPSVIHLISSTDIKNMLYPRIKSLVLGTKLLSVRVNCLLCLGKVLESLDKWLVLDEIIPLVMQIPSREPAVIMACIGILKLALNSNKIGISKELLANKVVPFLVPLSIENGLSIQQYNTVKGLIHEMLAKIEEEHEAKLIKLDSIKVTQNSFLNDNNQNHAIHSSNSMGNLLDSPLPGGDSAMFGGQSQSSTSLSLEDKQRLAREREQYERMKIDQKGLVPSPAISLNAVKSTNVLPPTVTDLTSTLIHSNLNSLNLNQANQKPNFSATGKLNSNSSSNNFKPNYNIDLSSLNIQPSNQFKPLANGIQSYPLNSSSMMMKPQPTSNQSIKPLSQSELDEFLN